MIATDTRTEALHCAGTAAPTWPSPPTRQPGSRSATPPAGATPTSCSTSPDPANANTLALGAAITRVLGDLAIVGIAGGILPVSLFSVPYEASVQTT